MCTNYEDMTAQLVMEYYDNPDNCRKAVEELLRTVVGYGVSCARSNTPYHVNTETLLAVLLDRAIGCLRRTLPHGCVHWYAVRERSWVNTFDIAKPFLLRMLRETYKKYPTRVIVDWVTYGRGIEGRAMAIITLARLEKEIFNGTDS